MSRLQEKPRLYEVDPDRLVWTPARSVYRKPSESQHRIGIEVGISFIASFCFWFFIIIILNMVVIVGVALTGGSVVFQNKPILCWFGLCFVWLGLTAFLFEHPHAEPE